MTLEQLAKIVRSDFKSLQPSEIVGRIMLVSNRDYLRAVTGFEIMEKNGLFDGFVDRQTVDKFELLCRINPEIITMADRLGMVPPIDTNKIKKPLFEEPARIRVAEVVKALSLPEF